MGDDRSPTVQPMHRLNVDAELWREVPNVAEGRCHVVRLEWCALPVIDGDPVRPWNFVTVEGGIATLDYCPLGRVSGTLAGEVSGVELRNRSVEVVEVEDDPRQKLSAATDFDDVENIGVKSPGALVPPPGLSSPQHQVLTAGGDDLRRHAFNAELSDCRNLGEEIISTLPY